MQTISGNLPIEAALSMYQSSPTPQPSAADIAEAREEIRDEIVAGKTRGGFDFAACLDCELNADGYMGTVHDLAAIVRNLHGDEHSAAGTWLAVLDLAERIVERHLPEQAVADRARKIAEARGEG